MRDTVFIILFGVLIYFGFANVLGESGLLGSFGAAFAKWNHLYFGYLSYIYIFVFLYPLYKSYSLHQVSLRTLELLIASFLLFFSLLLAQALTISNDMQGKLASDFASFLKPYIGIFGLWVFFGIIFSISLLILFDITTQEAVEWIKARRFRSGEKQQTQERRSKPSNTDYHDKNVSQNGKMEKSFETQEEMEQTEEKEQDIAQKTQVVKRDIPIVEEEIETIKEEEEVRTIVEVKPQENFKTVETKSQKNRKKGDEKEEHTIVALASKIKEEKSAVVVKELEENKKLLEAIEKGKTEKPKNFKLPKLSFLKKPEKKEENTDDNEILDKKVDQLMEKLEHFKIEGDVVRTYTGPIVSTFEFKPAANVKVSKILNLQDDLAMALSAETIRIQAPIPGKNVVGIEIPNEKRETIYLREILESKIFQEAASPLTMALGKDIVGTPFVTDLKKLPHLLIAGTTGSGKSVGINGMILSLLYKNSPDNLRLLMIDPKMLEFSIYNDIPHLLTPVITKPKQAVVALNNMVGEMERRYALMSDTRTKNIENYNEKAKQNGLEPLPYIVVIIDELSDLMMTSGKDVEHSIARLAQMARASGIHLIVATQRPSVDVVTGLIKANLPSRISYKVGQKIDSKIILDQQGAESLLGRGDMLFTPPGATGLVRLHAPWSSEEEIEQIVEFLKAQREPDYDKSFLVEENQEEGSGADKEVFEELDPLFEEAKNIVLTDRKTSISYLQRKLQIGYNRSARVIEQLEQEGILSAPNAKGIREILV